MNAVLSSRMEAQTIKPFLGVEDFLCIPKSLQNAYSDTLFIIANASVTRVIQIKYQMKYLKLFFLASAYYLI